MDDLSLRKTHFCSFEQRVLKILKSAEKEGQPLLLAVSGGLDSMVMAAVLGRLSAATRSALAISYIHHGRSKNQDSGHYRDRAHLFVKSWCEEQGLSFFSNVEKDIKEFGPEKSSESALREFRYMELEKIRLQWNSKAILCLAHHRDDLLETRLIRLIRGTGLQGLQAMDLQGEGEAGLFRPLLLESRENIDQYARENGMKWVEDPSNQSVEPLRNWLRQSWLPALEERRPGALEAVARSLSSVVEEAYASSRGGISEDIIKNEAISHPLFLELNRAEKMQVVARYLREQGFRAYGRSHIEEILRRLDSSQKRHTFTLLRRGWKVDHDWIRAGLE